MQMPYFYHPDNGYAHEGGFIADQLVKSGWVQIDNPLAHKLSLRAKESAPQESPPPNVHKTETEDCPVVAEPTRRKPGRPRKD